MRFRTFIFLFIGILIINALLFAQDTLRSQPDAQQATVPAVTQNSSNDSTTVQAFDPSTLTNITNFGSVWEITKLAGGLRWVIFAVLMFGIGSILYKYADFVLDSRRAKQINELNILTASLAQIEDIVTKNPDNLVHQLFSSMIKIFRASENAEEFHYEITNYAQLQQDKFDTFVGRMAFLSDTAGALGLLGTVWGMFVTFSRGILDNQVILTGMGFALVTTLMGLVVSIILNFLTTQIQGAFRKRMDALLVKGEELRLKLLQLQQKKYFKEYILGKKAHQQKEGTDFEIETEELISSEELKDAELFPLDDKNNSKYQLLSISGDKQKAEVNSRLKEPFIVQAKNGDGRGVSGQPVIFSVESGEGTLENGSKIREVITDDYGYARVNLKLGHKAGEYVVKANFKRSTNNEAIKFEAYGEAGAPAKLKYVSGNLQNSPAGQELKEPFVVKLVDSYDNVIVDYPVIFKVKTGEGFFPGNKRTYETRTDTNGIAKGYFTLRSKPGFNAIQVYAKGLKKSKIEFEALGQ